MVEVLRTIRGWWQEHRDYFPFYALLFCLAFLSALMLVSQWLTN